MARDESAVERFEHARTFTSGVRWRGATRAVDGASGARRHTGRHYDNISACFRSLCMETVLTTSNVPGRAAQCGQGAVWRS